jgi:hypothetical protein
MDLKKAHAASVNFLNITITNAEEVLELATDNTPRVTIARAEAEIKKAKEMIEQHKGVEATLRMMNDLRAADIALVKCVAEVKECERYVHPRNYIAAGGSRAA